MLERRLESLDTRFGIQGTVLTGVQSDIRTIGSKQDDIAHTLDRLHEEIEEDTETRAKERDEERRTTIRNLEETLARKGLSRDQKVLGLLLAFVTAFVGPLLILIITGHFS